MIRVVWGNLLVYSSHLVLSGMQPKQIYIYIYLLYTFYIFLHDVLVESLPWCPSRITYNDPFLSPDSRESPAISIPLPLWDFATGGDQRLQSQDCIGEMTGTPRVFNVCVKQLSSKIPWKNMNILKDIIVLITLQTYKLINKNQWSESIY